MITINEEMGVRLRHAGSVAAAIVAARREKNEIAAAYLSQLVLRDPGKLHELQSGCRLVDSNDVTYIMTDLFHLVRLSDGVTVNHTTGVAWPLEVRKCPRT